MVHHTPESSRALLSGLQDAHEDIGYLEEGRRPFSGQGNQDLVCARLESEKWLSQAHTQVLRQIRLPRKRVSTRSVHLWYQELCIRETARQQGRQRLLDEWGSRLAELALVLYRMDEIGLRIWKMRQTNDPTVNLRFYGEATILRQSLCPASIQEHRGDCTEYYNALNEIFHDGEDWENFHTYSLGERLELAKQIIELRRRFVTRQSDGCRPNVLLLPHAGDFEQNEDRDDDEYESEYESGYESGYEFEYQYEYEDEDEKEGEGEGEDDEDDELENNKPQPQAEPALNDQPRPQYLADEEVTTARVKEWLRHIC